MWSYAKKKYMGSVFILAHADKNRNGQEGVFRMEDKKLYYKVMLVAFLIILVLIGTGLYYHSREFQKAFDHYEPKGTVQQLRLDRPAE